MPHNIYYPSWRCTGHHKASLGTAGKSELSYASSCLARLYLSPCTLGGQVTGDQVAGVQVAR